MTTAVRARNIILLIGDGMGEAQRLAARLVRGNGHLTMDKLPYAGWMATSSADPVADVTDSAAAATALACGVKTHNGIVGMRPNGEPLVSVLELAKRAGKAVGLVTTCQITDATPAAFAAHVPIRSEHHEIARQYIEDAQVDLILGGGAEWWSPATEDTIDLVARAGDLGYRRVSTAHELHRATDAKLLGLFADQELFRQAPEGEDAHYSPPVTLDQMTVKALQVLARNPDGFFLMVEEAAIDRMAHYNNTRLAIHAVHELDRAVAVARAFAARDQETLVIVTADHECGGLTIDELESLGNPWSTLRWTTTGHTEARVPLNALGPSAHLLQGDFENTHVFAVMVEAMGLAVG